MAKGDNSMLVGGQSQMPQLGGQQQGAPIGPSPDMGVKLGMPMNMPRINPGGQMMPSRFGTMPFPGNGGGIPQFMPKFDMQLQRGGGGGKYGGGIK